MSTNPVMSLEACYNQGANAEMTRLLATLSADELNKDRKSYFRSLVGLYTHIAGGELFMLKQCHLALPSSDLFNDPALDHQTKPNAPAYQDFAAASSALAALDALYVKAAAGIQPGDLAAEMESHGGRQTVLKCLSMVAIHSAHHRGEIAQILDEMGIDNDFYVAGAKKC